MIMVNSFMRMKCKATARSGASRICNTVREQRSWQHSSSPQAVAELTALPASRILR